MSTFTISQQPESTDIFLYPISDASSGLSPYGETNNYECVDDDVLSPDSTTYVYTTSASTVYDMYGLTNHTTETGIINYVQINNRAMSYGLDQERLGNYYVLLGVSTATEMSTNMDVTQAYVDYGMTHTSQPSTAGTAWTWAAIDHLQSGVSCNSPQISGASVNRKYVPCSDMVAGEGKELYMWDNPRTFSGQGGSHWARVMDENILRGNGVGSGGGGTESAWHDDIYNTKPADSAASITSNVIQKITVTSKVVRWKESEYDSHYKCSIQIGSQATAYGTEHDRDSGLENGQNVFNDTWVSQPSGGGWTAAAVNQLKIGAAMMYEGSPNTGVALHDLNFTVYYTEDFTPQIRTTQSYARVNYIPSPTTVTLTMPDSLQVNHSRQVSRHTFNDGAYEVDDYGRGGKTLTISSVETSSTTETMQDLKDICHFGAAITVAGLPDTNLNTDYHIVDFGFQQQGGEVDIYRWNLTLEED